jgi:4-hydroxybenzoate polyprenyltransferase
MGGLTSILPSALSRGARDLRATLRMIAFEHTVFALPFAFAGAFLARRGLPTARETLWILLAMVGARSAAMTFNRIADVGYDARNPRTAARPLVTGTLSPRFAWTFLAASCALFLLAAAMLNRLAFALSFPVLALLLGYSYAKRVTWAAHLLLGACLGCAPIGAWVALRGDLAAAPLVLGLGVLCWTAGFDILYATQDVEFDREARLHSIPARWGIGAALRVARALHAAMILALLALGSVAGLGWIYRTGVAGTAALLLYEHSLVRPGDLSKLNRAFFTVNGVVSIFLFVMTAADLLSSR